MELSVTFLTEKHTMSMFLTALFAERLLNLSILYVTAAYTLFNLNGHWHRWPPAAKNKTEIRDHSFSSLKCLCDSSLRCNYIFFSYHSGIPFWEHSPYIWHLSSILCAFWLTEMLFSPGLLYACPSCACSIWKCKSMGYCMVCRIHVTWSHIKIVVYAWVLEANL
jgi:hypothetical protein